VSNHRLQVELAAGQQRLHLEPRRLALL
jgi:hypothetical protein